jgi:hypothetical protein
VPRPVHDIAKDYVTVGCMCMAAARRAVPSA